MLRSNFLKRSFSFFFVVGVACILFSCTKSLSPLSESQILKIPNIWNGSTHLNLSFSSVPATAQVGVALAPSVQLSVTDDSGNLITPSGSNVTISLNSGSPNGNLGGSITAPVSGGIASFSNLSVTHSGQAFVLKATLQAGNANVATTLSSSLNVLPTGSSHAVYYLSPTGSDANSGTSAAQPWLSPNHNLNCGDSIVALPSTAYSSTNFVAGNWGTVNCPGNNSVAWLKCQQFDQCKITVPNGTHNFGMAVSSSYWGVQGWEISNLGTGSNDLNCFIATPAGSNTIHHIIFANNIANVCPLGGFGSAPFFDGYTSAYANSGVDYLAIVGNIAYRAGVSNLGCGSGISIYQPNASDTLSGTHQYIAGNISYGTVNPSGCWDGNGIILDTFDHHGSAAFPQSYAGQSLIENNISIGNAGVGVRVEYNNTAGPGPNFAPVTVRNNTSWSNSNDTFQSGSSDCGEFQIYRTLNTSLIQNLGVTNQVGCYGNSGVPDPAYQAKEVDATSSAFNNWGFAQSSVSSSVVTSPNFSFSSNNNFGTDPELTHPVVPSAPSCGGMSTTVQCMSSSISGFQPLNVSAVAYGYQSPVTTPAHDPMFPHWLCSSDLPVGLISLPCLDQ